MCVFRISLCLIVVQLCTHIHCTFIIVNLVFGQSSEIHNIKAHYLNFPSYPLYSRLPNIYKPSRSQLPSFPENVSAVKFWTPNRHLSDTAERRANLCVRLYITYWYTLPWLTSVNHATWSNGWVCWGDKILSASKLIRILQATKKQIKVHLYGVIYLCSW